MIHTSRQTWSIERWQSSNRCGSAHARFLHLLAIASSIGLTWQQQVCNLGQRKEQPRWSMNLFCCVTQFACCYIIFAVGTWARKTGTNRGYYSAGVGQSLVHAPWQVNLLVNNWTKARDVSGLQGRYRGINVIELFRTTALLLTYHSLWLLSIVMDLRIQLIWTAFSTMFFVYKFSGT